MSMRMATEHGCNLQAHIIGLMMSIALVMVQIFLPTVIYFVKKIDEFRGEKNQFAPR